MKPKMNNNLDSGIKVPFNMNSDADSQLSLPMRGGCLTTTKKDNLKNNRAAFRSRMAGSLTMQSFNKEARPKEDDNERPSLIYKIDEEEPLKFNREIGDNLETEQS